MQITSNTPLALNLTRRGGSIITARLDCWSATQQGWKLAGSAVFQDVTKPSEPQSISPLAKGQYTAVFTCRVEESINGVYEFTFSAANQQLYADKGNVNTSPAPNDWKAYKDQFILDIV